jgi:hypothetical protein
MPNYCGTNDREKYGVDRYFGIGMGRVAAGCCPTDCQQASDPINDIAQPRSDCRFFGELPVITTILLSPIGTLHRIFAILRKQADANSVSACVICWV